MLREIALDSRKNKNYVIIVSVSDQEKAQEILELNGNEKILELGSSTDLVRKYLKQSLHHMTWNETVKEKLVELATKAGAPGFLFYLKELKKPTD